MKLKRTTIIIALLPALLTGIVVALLIGQLNTVNQTRSAEERGRKALNELLSLEHVMAATGLSLLRYSDELDPGARERFEIMRGEFPRVFDELDRVSTSKATRETACELARHMGHMIAMSDEIVWSAPLAPSDLCPIRMNELRSGLSPNVLKLGQLTDHFRQQLSQELDAQSARTLSLSERAQQIAWCGFGITALASFLVAFLLSRRIVSRLSVIEENNRRFPSGQDLLPPLAGSDEIKELDDAFRSMATNLTTARIKEKEAVQNSADAIFTLDKKFHVLEKNAASELLDPQLTEVIQDAEVRSFLQSLGPSNKTAQLETGNFLLSAAYSDTDERIFCVAHDVRERKELQQAIRENIARDQLIESSIPAAVIMFDDAGTIHGANGKAEELLDLVPDLNALLSANALPVEVSVDKLPSMQGQQAMSLAVIFDLRERKKLEEEKQKLLSLVAEQIATPLSAIESTLQTLSSDVSDTAQPKVAAAASESRRLVRLFDELLQAVRRQPIPLSISPAPLRITDLIESSIDSVREQCSAREIQLQFIHGSNLPLIKADPDRIQQVLINLLSNAMKFSKNGDTITVKAEPGENAVQISVSDEGRGIPSEFLPKIFEPFVQAEAEDHSIKGGTGLGLSICRSIIDGHGGTIEVHNNDIAGCTFVFRLPA